MTTSAASGVTRADGEDDGAVHKLVERMIDKHWLPAEDWEQEATAFVNALYDALDVQRAKIHAQVLAIHRPAHETGPTSCVECNQGRKFVPWPCATAAAFGGATR